MIGRIRRVGPGRPGGNVHQGHQGTAMDKVDTVEVLPANVEFEHRATIGPLDIAVSQNRIEPFSCRPHDLCQSGDRRVAAMRPQMI
jgi:hypothetical protein